MNKRWMMWAAWGLLAGWSASASAQVVISEFMAKNDETIVDGDGNYSDWVELYNSGESAVDLTGWYLSDDATNLTKWTFPAASIGAGDYLVLFCSGQDAEGYTDSLGYLHTTFKLSGSGESVVLTLADGTTVASSFINYPEQDDDVSYGLEQEVSYSYLISEGADATAIAGTSEPSTNWNAVSFDDSTWTASSTGVGFEEVETSWTGSGRPPRDWVPEVAIYDDLINLDLSAMLDSTASAYIRVPFTYDASTGVSQLALRMKYDDGFVAYVNGAQVAAANAPASLSYASTATEEHSGLEYEDYTILAAGALLQDGENVLAIHGLNLSAADTDFVIYPMMTGITAGELKTNSVLYLAYPTPGYENVDGVLGYVADTTFSVDRGFYTNAFEVEIACKTDGAQIYYTVDGTTPTMDNGTLYTGAITIAQTTVLRAAAFLTGYQPSDTDTQTYLFLEDIISQGSDVSGLAPAFPASAVNGQDFDYGMDADITQGAYSNEIQSALMAIPSISIVTDPDNLFDATSGIYVNASEGGELWEREMSVELINPDGTDGFQINGGMRIRGASSASSGNPKHSFRLFFRSEYGTSRLNYPLFGDEGVDSFKRMDLRTGQNFSWANQNPQYATWLYDIFTRDTHRDMEQPYTRGEYYHLYINGMYWGLYQTEERCNADYAESYYGDDDADFDAVKSDADTGDMYAVDGTREAYDELWAGAYGGVSDNASYFALQGMNADGSENSSYTKLLDVDNVIDYMLLVYFTANRDSPVGPPMNSPTMPRNLNVIYNRNHPDGMKFVAHDNEHTMEYSEGVDHNRFTTSLSSSFDEVDFFNPWSLHLKLMENEEYALRFADHVHDYFFNEGLLTAEKNESRLEARKAEIYSAVVAESARWGDSTGTLYTRDDDWLTYANWLTDTYLAQRTDIVLGQIESMGWYPSVDAPEFNQHGGAIEAGFTLSISGSGTIYYTTDGSDPRETGGGVAGIAYSSAITLDHSAQVKARVLSGGEWSALTQATFVLDEESPLRVTEIMYNPLDTDPEFIELYNAGSETIGLAGTEFSDGILFDFTDGDTATLAPGDYAVVVNDYDAFTNRYANWADIKIAGQYHGKFFIATGALNNAGESISLVDGLGQTILDFEYDDWYDITDGDGYSLTLIDPTAETNVWSESSAWRPSASVGGTPGYAAVADFPNPDDLVINEALTHQDTDIPGDWVEIYNTSTNTLDLNGWFLSDDADELAMVELNGVDALAPGDYLVLTEASDFGLEAAGTNGFALSELGESVYLSSGENGALTGYRVQASFGASERDVTFGRHVKSDGSVDFTAQSAQTSGATNAYPLVGDVVFTEILYHPADSNGFEFVEISNRSDAAVTLAHATATTNTWKLEGAVEFTFPEGTVLAAGESLVVTETNEAAFRSYYSVDAGVTVLGPYDGQLDNAGEDLYLTRPGDPEVLTGEIPYIVVERVDFDDELPWPVEADGLGASLERVDATLYPNDAANWSANSSPSPGSTAVTVNLDSDGDGMADAWEIYYFESMSAVNGGADEDWDADGSSNYDEYVAGTDPTDASSCFSFSSVESASPCIFSWTSESGKVYRLWSSTNLVSGAFELYESDIAATPPVNVFTSEVSAVSSLFFSVSVQED